ncbi:MAG: hypothetical protein CMG75_10810 [Candidatus Marinimicrobia bacterium]|jgi:hypothetical protein|nr:hypothetical protein [Candidatus Neomarinimicrobiota bacterium]|tara:strand:+ start:207 stop:656 length:450 start_codon:yes stop_codon:yes gene_type:complete
MITRIFFTLLFSIGIIFAQRGETWEVSESVYAVSTIDLEPNVDQQYINQLKLTWYNNMEVFKSEGLIEDFHIYKSINQYDGDFDLLLVVKYKNLAIFDSNSKNNKRWKKAEDKARKIISEEEVQNITSNFPKLRTILDQKFMREINFIE